MFGLIPRKRVGLATEMERLFDEIWSPLDVLRWPSDGRFVPKVDVVDTGDAVEIKAEVPGLEEKDLDVSLEGNHLRIKGEKKEERKEEQKGHYLLERSYGTFERHLTLPENLDAGKVDARFKNGVLHITVPKTEEAAPKKIDIKS